MRSDVKNEEDDEIEEPGQRHPVARYFIFICFLIIIPLVVSQFREDSDLVPDHSVVRDGLSNGVKYVLKRNETPKDRIYLRMLVHTGSFMESDDDFGLAHFAEHMALKSLRNFPNNSLIPSLEKIGMNFGHDVNAYTAFNYTVFQLNIPSEKELDKALMIFRDQADGELFTPEDIDSERKVVLSEIVARDSVDQRIDIACIKALFPNTIVAKRYPISGKAENVKRFQQKDFIEFRRLWYRPTKLVILAAGDFNVDNMEALIKKHFKSLRDTYPYPQIPSFVLDPHDPALAADYHYEPNATHTTVTYASISPLERSAYSKALFKEDIRNLICQQIIDLRLQKIMKRPDAPFFSSRLDFSPWLQSVYVTDLTLDCAPNAWEKALQVLEQEVRRVLLFGFNEDEITPLKANIIAIAENNMKGADTRDSNDIASTFINSVLNYRVPMTPQTVYATTKLALMDLTQKDLLEAFKKIWLGQHKHIFVTGNVKIPADKAPVILYNAYKNSTRIVVEPQEKIADKPFAYTTFGKPGTVVSETLNKDLNATFITFSNNVRLTFKHHTFEKDCVYVTIHSGGGLLETPQSGLKIVAEETFVRGGLKAHSFEEIRRIFAGKLVGLNFSVANNAFEFFGSTTPQDLPTQLQLMCAYFTNPGFRQDAFPEFQKSIETEYRRLYTTINGTLQDRVDKYLTSNDPRFGFPPRETLFKYTPKDVEAFLKNTLGKSYLEITIVGDVDKDAVVHAILPTFAAIPTRDAAKPAFEKESILNFPANRAPKTFVINTHVQKAFVGLYWPASDTWNRLDSRPLTVLAQIIDNRLMDVIRSATGQTYSPGAKYEPSATFRNYSTLSAYTLVDPTQVKSVLQKMHEIVKDLSTKGFSNEEFQRALPSIITSLKTAITTTRYWQSKLADVQNKPAKIDLIKTHLDDYSRMTKEHVDAVLKKYLVPEKALPILILPKRP